MLICHQSFGQAVVQKLDSLLLKNFPENQPGAALLVAKNGNILYQKGFGLTDIDPGKR